MPKILFIEDDPALQETLGGFLRQQGYTVLSALEGRSGLEFARREHPDLILQDLILPGRTGLEIFEALRSEPDLARIPVIVLTNVESSQSVQRAVELGAAAYLVKTSYSLEEVGQKIRAVLGQE